MLICESLFLLLVRDDVKPESAFTEGDYGLAAAVITDLILAERVTLSDDEDPRVSVVSAEPTGHPVLDQALERVAEKDGSRLSALVTDRKFGLEQATAASLASAGVIRIEEKRRLGLIPERYPVLDPAPEAEMRRRLAAVLAGSSAGPEEATLLAILQGLGVTEKVLADERGALDKKRLAERIEEISHDAGAGGAVAAAVKRMNDALVATVIVPIVISGT